jgi:hypothetical protein
MASPATKPPGSPPWSPRAPGFLPWIAANWEAIDADRDGRLSLSELKAVIIDRNLSDAELTEVWVRHPAP